MLSIKKLSIYLVNDLRTVIENFSFSLESGMKVCIIGEEGNGKSSILKAIVDYEGLKEYAEISGEINKKNEVITNCKNKLANWKNFKRCFIVK